MVNGEWVAADSLVVSFFKPFNPFPELRGGVGQAVIDTYDSSVVMESSRILARELAAGGEGGARR